MSSVKCPCVFSNIRYMLYMYMMFRRTTTLFKCFYNSVMISPGSSSLSRKLHKIDQLICKWKKYRENLGHLVYFKVLPVAAAYESACLINGGKGEINETIVKWFRRRPLDGKKQRGSIGNTVSRTGIFFSLLSFSSLLYLSCISRRVCMQFIVISPVPGTHEWEI